MVFGLFQTPRNKDSVIRPKEYSLNTQLFLPSKLHLKWKSTLLRPDYLFSDLSERPSDRWALPDNLRCPKQREGFLVETRASRDFPYFGCRNSNCWVLPYSPSRQEAFPSAIDETSTSPQIHPPKFYPNAMVFGGGACGR